MKLKKRYILIIFLFLVAIISLGSVAATDDVVTSTDNSNVIDTNETTEFQEIISNETINQENNVRLDNEMSLKMEESSLNDNVNIGQVNYENDSFTALDNLITNDTIGTITLEHDYIMYTEEVSTYGNGIVINKNIAIIGNGHCINANKIGRIFNIISDGVVLTLNNITLKNGNLVKLYSAFGGAIYSNSTVNLICEDVTFVNNTVTNTATGIFAEYGGGGAIHAKVSVTINKGNVSFVNNSADVGGAIHAPNVIVNADSVSFVNNTASGSGGAIYAIDSVIVNSTSVSFVNNTATEKHFLEGDLTSGFGGAILTCDGNVTFNAGNVSFINNNAFLCGGAISTYYGSVTFNAGNMSFINNTGTKGSGGAIFTYESGSVTINECNVSFINNTANEGGAIAARDSVTFNAGNMSFVNNTAAMSGGAIYTSRDVIVNSTNVSFVNNTAYEGGVISTYYGGVTFYAGNVSFVNNAASSLGGAILSYYGGVTFYAGNVSFINNTAYEGGAIEARGSVTFYAGNVSFVNNTVAMIGGAIYSSGGVIINSTSLSFVNNTAANFASAIYAEGSGVTVNAGSVNFVNNTGNSVIEASGGSIANSTFIGNHIIYGIPTVYNNCVLTTFVNNKLATTINPNENFNLTAKLVDDKGNTYYSNGLTYQIYNDGYLIRTVNDVDGLFNAITNLKDSGVYDIAAKYNDPDRMITGYSMKATVYINDNKVIITGKNLIKYYKGNKNYNIYLKSSEGIPLAGETVAVTINGVTYDFVTDINGLISLPIGLSVGNYIILSVYNGYYGVTGLENTITVKSTIKGEDTTVYYRNGSSYVVHVMDSQGRTVVGQNVRMNINGVFYDRVTDSKGNAYLPIGLNAGKYIITAENPTNGEKTSNIVTVLPTLVDGQDVTVYHRNGSGYSIKVLDGQGNPACGVTVRMNINGVFYDRVTDSNGYAFLPIGLSPGEYIITTEYNGFMTSNKITVLPVLIGEDIRLYYRDGTSYKVKLVDGQGKPLTYTNVSMNINGVFYYRTTNTDGVADLPIGLLPGKYIITTTYQDHATSNKVTVLSRD